MTAMTHSDESPTDPMRRSRIYRLLALGFKYPTREVFDLFQNGQYITELIWTISSLPHFPDVTWEEAGLADQISHDLQGVDFEDFETAYVGTFDVGYPEPPCPPYEGFYTEAMPRTEVMLEVGSFYTHFGLAMNLEEGKRELPDYLCAELEFMHFLTFKEARAREAADQNLVDGYLLAQKDFLERHMVGWLSKFFERLLEVDGLPFYPDLARILARFVTGEFALLRTAAPEGVCASS